MIYSILNLYFRTKYSILLWFVLIPGFILFINTFELNKLYLNAYVSFVFHLLPALLLFYYSIKFKLNKTINFIYLISIIFFFFSINFKYVLEISNTTIEYYEVGNIILLLIYSSNLLKYLNKLNKIQSKSATLIFFSLLFYFPVGIWVLHDNFKLLNNIYQLGDESHE